MSSHVSQRQAHNMKILRKIEAYIRKHPDQRFGQILRNSGAILDKYDGDGPPKWINEFNTEPHVILKRMEDYEKKD